MKNAYILALLAYALFSTMDALVKAVGKLHLSVFEIGFVINIVALAVLLATRHPGERWRDFHLTERRPVVLGRAFCGVVSGLGGVHAFTTIPMAEAYALIFLSPAFVTILSATLLREKVGVWRWSAVVLGFLGVLMVLRPGIVPLQAGHLSALVVSLAVSGAIILMRGPGRGLKRTSLLGTLFLALISANLAGMLLTGFTLPTPRELAMLAIGGAVYGIGQWAFLMAPRYGTANQIAPMHYIQLLLAVIFGILFFGEYPDAMTLAGMAVIASAGLVILGREHWLRRHPTVPATR